ncbi:hypothetical protein, partial [Rhizobium leguminosarum]|uniref:hypothetical protein n=1 Tax=Rhizobium leguminosarum TaxID=384 RepID=UPI001FF00AD6
MSMNSMSKRRGSARRAPSVSTFPLAGGVSHCSSTKSEIATYSSPSVRYCGGSFTVKAWRSGIPLVVLTGHLLASMPGGRP